MPSIENVTIRDIDGRWLSPEKTPFSANKSTPTPQKPKRNQEKLNSSLNKKMKTNFHALGSVSTFLHFIHFYFF